MLSQIIRNLSTRARAKRSTIFWKYLNPCEEDRILDLGSGDGSYMASVVPFRNNVYIADISKVKLERGNKKYGFKVLLLSEEDCLPVPDKFFDIVFCSSVIEHVTVDKNKIWKMQNSDTFSKLAYERQKIFAKEINRVGKKYYVQTPNKYFIMETHTWLPFVSLFSRKLLIKTIIFLNTFWPKKTTPDWYLLSKKQMRELFPDATIVTEKFLGMVNPDSAN